MKLKIMFHDQCFDGASSASLFARFYREVVDPTAEIEFVGKRHARGPVFDDRDFTADDHVVLDFRYVADPRLGWWIDHHVSAFSSAADLEHFRTRPRDHFFYDPNARSCAGLIVRSLVSSWGWDAGNYEELLRWAEIIDGAQFTSAEEATSLAEPALRLAAFVEHNTSPALTTRLCEQLATRPLAELAREPWIDPLVQSIAAQQRASEALIAPRIHVTDGVALVDLGDEGCGYNKFSPYKLAPDATYVVTVSAAHGTAKVSVGINPWRRPASHHHIATLCERYGGGGHAVVGAVTLPTATPAVLAEARTIADEMVTQLRKDP
ncbi:MAG: phosphoesterase [Polyangia bacterium]